MRCQLSTQWVAWQGATTRLDRWRAKPSAITQHHVFFNQIKLSKITENRGWEVHTIRHKPQHSTTVADRKFAKRAGHTNFTVWDKPRVWVEADTAATEMRDKAVVWRTIDRAWCKRSWDRANRAIVMIRRRAYGSENCKREKKVGSQIVYHSVQEITQ